MRPGKPRDERKEQQWRRWLGAWRASGLSAAAFCARHALAQPSFYARRRTLQQRQRAVPCLLPVCVLPEVSPAATRGVEVVMAGDRCLRVPPGFDPATLRQLLALLEEEATPC
jgi:transposase